MLFHGPQKSNKWIIIRMQVTKVKVNFTTATSAKTTLTPATLDVARILKTTWNSEKFKISLKSSAQKVRREKLNMT